MKYENGALTERDPDSVAPLGWHMVVEYIAQERKGIIIKPDAAAKGDMKPKEGFFGKVVKLGTKFNGEYAVGDMLVFDESNNPFDKTRAFTWLGKHYVICNIDKEVVIGKLEASNA